MSTENPGEDLFPALESLSRSIAPHFKTIVFVALVLNQTPLFPDLKTLVVSQLSNPLVLIVALYFGGIWTLPTGQENNEGIWQSLLGPIYALKTVSNSVGTYLKGREKEVIQGSRITNVQLPSWLVARSCLPLVSVLQLLSPFRTMGPNSICRHFQCCLYFRIPLCAH